MKYIALSFVLSAVVLTGIVSMSYGEELTCFGKVATIIGTADTDEIFGTDGDDVIVGLSGNDVIHALDGNDIICPGPGRNIVYGDAGNDIIVTVGPDRTIFYDGPGNDTCYVDDPDLLRVCQNVFTRAQAVIDAEENANNPGNPNKDILIISSPTLVNLNGRALEDTEIGDDISIQTTITNEGTVRSENALMEYFITDPDNQVERETRIVQKLNAGDSIVLDEFIIVDKPGLYSISVTVFDSPSGNGEILKGPDVVTVSTPIPTGTLIIDNFGIRHPNTGVILSSIDTGESFAVTATVNNDRLTETTFFWEVNISGPDDITTAFSRTVEPLTTTLIAFTNFAPLKSGTYIITLDIFDNEIDRNPLFPQFQGTIESTGLNVFTFDDLVELVLQLQARIVVLEGN